MKTWFLKLNISALGLAFTSVAVGQMNKPANLVTLKAQAIQIEKLNSGNKVALKNLQLGKVKLSKERLKIAPEGGIHGGGGNTVGHRMIESYGKTSEQFIGKNNFAAIFFKNLENSIPGFAKVLQGSAENLTWYVIPRSISELPADQTGLHFSSDQTAYQENDEVFINEIKFKKMNEEEIFRLYVHELLMAEYLEMKKNGSEVTMANLRKVVILLTTAEYIPVLKLRDAIENNKFGFYTVDDDYKNIQQGFLASVQKAKNICAQPFRSYKSAYDQDKDSVVDIAQGFANPQYDGEITDRSGFGPSAREALFYSIIIQEPFINVFSVIFKRLGSAEDSMALQNYRDQKGLSIPENRNEKFEQICKILKEQY